MAMFGAKNQAVSAGRTRVESMAGSSSFTNCSKCEVTAEWRGRSTLAAAATRCRPHSGGLSLRRMHRLAARPPLQRLVTKLSLITAIGESSRGSSSRRTSTSQGLPLAGARCQVTSCHLQFHPPSPTVPSTDTKLVTAPDDIPIPPTTQHARHGSRYGHASAGTARRRHRGLCPRGPLPRRGPLVPGPPRRRPLPGHRGPSQGKDAARGMHDGRTAPADTQKLTGRPTTVRNTHHQRRDQGRRELLGRQRKDPTRGHTALKEACR
jgi:hypothetical protein